MIVLLNCINNKQSLFFQTKSVIFFFKEKWWYINHTHVKKGTPQNFCFTFTDELEIQLIIKKLFEWANKKCLVLIRILIFTLLDFSKNTYTKTPGGIIILHLCTKKFDDMIYSSWECDRLKLVIMGHFLPFNPLPLSKNPNKSGFWKNKKKLLEISFYTCVPKITIMRYSSLEFFWHFGSFSALWPS